MGLARKPGRGVGKRQHSLVGAGMAILS